MDDGRIVLYYDATIDELKMLAFLETWNPSDEEMIFKFHDLGKLTPARMFHLTHTAN